jgi:DUF4097 and DUF4098 domain-containing protein YvlB
MRTGWMAAGLLALAACGFTYHMGDLGNGLVERDGVLYKDGVALRSHRWVTVAVPAETGGLTLESGTADIDLASGPTSLEVQLFSEVEGDGSVALQGDQPVASSAGGHAVVINGVRGTIAPEIALHVKNGTGNVRVDGLKGAHALDAESGTGDVSLSKCALGTVGVKCGTGRIELTDSTVESLNAENGTGDIRLKGCRLKGGRLESGTGDIVLSGHSDLGSASTQLGTGHVRNSD